MRQLIPILFILTAVIIGCSIPNNKLSATNFTVDSLKEVTTKDFAEMENNDCVFDTSTYKFTTQALKEYKANIKFTWNDIEKEAKTVMENGDTLTLHIGGCDHFSYAATLVTDIPFTETENLIAKAGWLAKTFFDGGFDTKYDSCISKGLFKEEELLEKENLKSYNIIDPDTAATNMIYEGFQFRKLKDKTKIAISGYIN